MKKKRKRKKLLKWVPHELTENKKKSFFLLLLYTTTMNIPNQIVTCDEKWTLYDNHWWPAQWLDWEVPMHFPKQKLQPKKVMVTLWWSAAQLIHYIFLNPGKTITSEKYTQQISKIHWKLQCLQPVLVNRKGPILQDNSWLHITQPTLSKMDKLDYEVLPHLPYFIWSLANHHCKRLNSFLQGKRFHTCQEAENAFQEFIEPWSMDFYATGMNRLISHWQKWVDCNGF